MKFLRFISLIISLIILTQSCNNNLKDANHCKNVLENILKIKITDSITLIEQNSDFAIGDYNERFKLRLSKNDFNKVLKSIDSSKLKKINNMNLYYFNIHNNEEEFISIILNPTKFTVQYSMNSE